MKQGRNRYRPDAYERIDYHVSRVCEGKNEPLWNLNRKLTRVSRFLDVVALHVRNDPDIPRILAERIAGILTTTIPFVSELARVLLRDSHRVEIENIFISLRIPQDCFVHVDNTILANKPI